MKVTLKGELFLHRKSEIALDILMRIFNVCKRFAYKRLLEGEKRKELKKILQKKFNINSRYCDDAILKAQETKDALEALGANVKKVIWGGKKLFRKLSDAKKKNDEKKIEKLKEIWKDKRQGSVYSRGDKNKGGNLNLRIYHIKSSKFKLRINIGTRKWIFVPFFLGKKYAQKLLEILEQKNCLYSVEILRREKRYFINITVEENLPKPQINFKNGAIGIDLNAFPSHIAWAEIDSKGNLLDSGKIGTPHLYDSRSNKRAWWRGEYARQLIELSKEKKKALVLENLNFSMPGKKKIKSRKLRRILSNFNYSSLKQAIIRQAAKNAIDIITVFPAYTSIIGFLKYKKMYSLTTHKSAAFVIARRGLGYKEKLNQYLIEIANCEGLSNGKLKESTDGRNSSQTLIGCPVSWLLWRALYKAVLTGHSIKTIPNSKGRGT